MFHITNNPSLPGSRQCDLNYAGHMQSLTKRTVLPRIIPPLMTIETYAMPIQEGQKLPSIQLFTMADGRPTPIMSDEIFAGKKVVLFAVPGAYTPTCSQAHLPGYVVNADAFAEKGAELVCLSVNDPFVMGSWGESANADAIKMIADGNGEFTKALGLEMDGSSFGLGTRSQRYAMLVDDGVVTKLNIEDPGKFEVSNAETMLDIL